MWTDRERLVICRRRQQWTQRQAAKFFKVHPVTYSNWERGVKPMPDKAVRFVGRFASILKAHEVCKLLRRRLGLSIKQAAEGVERSHTNIIMAERGTACPERYKRWLEIAYELKFEEIT